MSTKNFLWVSTILISIGLAIGFFGRPHLMPMAAVEPADEAEADHPTDDGHGSAKIVELEEATLENMALKIGKFESRDYIEQVVIPAEFVERLPDGRHAVTAPISGRVEQVNVAPGQAVAPGQELFELSVTDEQISEAQVGMLAVISDISNTSQLLERSQRLAKKQIVPGKSVLELEFKLKGLESRQRALEQELLLRGLSENQLDKLKRDKVLVKSISLSAPPLTVSSSNPKQNLYSVESLRALVGKNLARGEALCELIHHGRLLVKGMAFESDVEKISAAQEQGWGLNVIVGEGEEVLVREGLSLHSIDNHVDETSQTYSVFVAIENEIVGNSLDSSQRSYVQWKFKSGQRAHLEIPVREWKGEVVIPVSALVQEGPESFVFKKIDHTHASADGTIIHEFEKVPVAVLHVDSRFAVVEKQVSLDLYEKYALDKAYQLNLALKQAATGGGGGHGHSHDGHSH